MAVLLTDYECPDCSDTGLLADGETLCGCPAAASVYGPDDELPVWPSADAEDRAALRLG